MTPDNTSIKAAAGKTLLKDDPYKASKCVANQDNLSQRTPLVAKVTGQDIKDTPRVINVIVQGIPFTAIEQLTAGLNVDRKELAKLLSISPRTFARRKKEGRFNQHESDRMVRFARLKDLAMDMMLGQHDATLRWLHCPLEALSAETPLDRSRTEIGAREVENLIIRLQHGVFN